MQKVLIASDHAGYDVKERIKKELGSQFEFVDLGTNSTDSVDYPDFAEKLAQQVAVSSDVKGVLVCGSGVGISIAANKVDGARCVLAYSVDAAKGSREHNNANIVAVPGRLNPMDDQVKVVKAFLETDFSTEERHARRVKKMMDIEKHN